MIYLVSFLISWIPFEDVEPSANSLVLYYLYLAFCADLPTREMSWFELNDDADGWIFTLNFREKK